MVSRVYVEKKPGFDGEAKSLERELRGLLGVSALTNLRIINRYDVEGASEELFASCVPTVFSEPQTDDAWAQMPEVAPGSQVFAVEFLPGQFDQRADSASECIQLISQGERPTVRSAKVYVLEGDLTPADVDAIKHYVINPVEAREASLEERKTLLQDYPTPEPVEQLEGFLDLTDEELAQLNEWLCGYREEANNVVYATPVNGFFLSSYENVRDMDFVDFLSYFPGEAGGITEAEFQALKTMLKTQGKWDFGPAAEDLAEMPVPIHRIPAKTVNETLTEYAGITTDDLWDRSGVCYLPETDAYYNFTSDFGPGYFQADYGETTGDSAWLWYGSDCLTLGRETDGWKIRSYQGPWEAMPYAKTISYYLEGQEQSETFTRYRGNGWYLYLPQGWEKDADADLWRYTANRDIRLEVRDMGTLDLAEAQAAIRAAEGMTLAEGKQGDLLGDDGKTVLRVAFHRASWGICAVRCRYPVEAAEGGGVRLQVIADTFRMKD